MRRLLFLTNFFILFISCHTHSGIGKENNLSNNNNHTPATNIEKPETIEASDTFKVNNSSQNKIPASNSSVNLNIKQRIEHKTDNQNKLDSIKLAKAKLKK